MDLFHCTHDKKLDRSYLRVCAVYRLLKTRRVNKARAVELLVTHRRIRFQQGQCMPVRDATALVELWLAGPLTAVTLEMKLSPSVPTATDRAIRVNTLKRTFARRTKYSQFGVGER